MIQLPENYKQEMKELLKEEYADYLASMEQPYNRALRVNTLKISVEDFQKSVPFHLTPVPWCSDGFYYAEEDNVTAHPYYYAGLYYLQEASAMLPAEALPIEEGDIVLDACAAPGGKSLKLAAKLNGTGCLLSNDISASRSQALLRNIEKSGIKNAYVTSEDIAKLARKYPNTFDKILIDAPCSGEGMFRKDPSLIRSYEEHGSSYYAPIQKEILNHAVSMLKKGGFILYSTCTFSREEDEEVLQAIFHEHEDLSLVPLKPYYEGFAKGIGENMEHAVRLYPHRLNGEGHFTALLKKEGKNQKEDSGNATPLAKLPKEMQEFAALIAPDFFRGTVQKIQNSLYLISHAIDNTSVRTLRSGLLLGEIRNGRFEPSQALAMALKKEEFAQCISFSANDAAIEKYLRGETVFTSAKYNGWVLICVDDYPLGFGKMQNGQIKNKIKAGVRKL